MAQQPNSLSPEIRQLQVSVRELARFSHGRWNRCREGGASVADGREEQARLQGARPTHYRTEVQLSGSFRQDTFLVEVGGRADGVYEECPPIIEEIKATRRGPGVLEERDLAHWAQLKIYGYLLCRRRGLSECVLHLTYSLVPSGRVQVFVERMDFFELAAEFDELLGRYLAWMAALNAWREERNRRLGRTAFPFGRRPGQSNIEAWVKLAVRDARTVLVEAPTGLGKTLSVLYAALGALGTGAIDQIEYACPRVTGRARALEALSTLGADNFCRTVVLSARDQLCDGFCSDQLTAEERCRLRLCLFEHYTFESCRLQRLALEWGVCPYSLSRELARWADIVVADYHHWMTPFFSGEGTLKTRSKCLLLVDEAHQVPDRGRVLYSADLEVRILQRLAAQGEGYRAESHCRVDYLAEESEEPWVFGPRPPASLLHWLEGCSAELQELSLEEFSALDAEVQETVWKLSRFLRFLGSRQDGFACWRSAGPDSCLHLDCLDPFPTLRRQLANYNGSVLFSATMQPVQLFQGLLEGESESACNTVPAVFPGENLRVLRVLNLTTTYRARRRELTRLGCWLQAYGQSLPGHGLICFSSYQYLRQGLESFYLAGAVAGHDVCCEEPAMSQREKQLWLDRLRAERPFCLAFCVLGGSFTEGVDLSGSLLRGVAIVGPGVPPPSFRRNLIYQHFEELGESGFLHAYRGPGIRKVIQAAGRVIRSPRDRGVVVLLGRRFSHPEYAELLPRSWSIADVRSPADLRDAMTAFWRER